MKKLQFNPKDYRGTTRWGARLYVHPDPNKAEKGYYLIDNGNHKAWGQPVNSSRTKSVLLAVYNVIAILALLIGWQILWGI